MKELVLFSIVVYGISNIVVYSTMFEWWRKFTMWISPKILGKLFTCMMCFPTWCGFLISTVLHLYGIGHLTPMGNWGIDVTWLAIFLDGCVASATTWGINIILEYFEYNTPPSE
jgi:hypothetical protein